jgi:hypothetical protein
MQIYSLKFKKRVDLLRHENIENVIKALTRQKTIVYRDVVLVTVYKLDVRSVRKC